MSNAEKSLLKNLVDAIKTYSQNDEVLYEKMKEIFKISAEKTKEQLKQQIDDA